MQPISQHERIQLLDVLRGFAIFGMFTVNMTVDIWWGDSLREAELSLADFISVVFVDLFTNGKFITMFTFLYGIGFFVQMERNRVRKISPTGFHIRRSAGLLLIGVTAMTCTIPAWILVDYAIFGIGLLLFLNRKPRAILIAAVAMMIIAKVFGGIIPDIREYQQEKAQASELAIPSNTDQEDSMKKIMSEGSFKEVSLFRLSRLWKAFTDWEYYIGELDLLGLMLIGLYVARRGAIWDPDIRRSMARKSLPWLVSIGFTGCLVFVILADFSVVDKSTLAHKIIRSLVAWPLGMPVLGLGYVATISLLFENKFWKKILIPFAAVGRTALTNYLFTGLVAAFICFSWGLRLYGKLTTWQGLLLVFLIFPLQVLISKWWITKFNFGPAEWLWRFMTYGKLPPIGHTKKAIK